MIDQTFLDNLPEDPLNTIRAIAEMVNNRYMNQNPEERWADYDFYIEVFGLFQAFAEASNLGFTYPQLTTDKHQNMEQIYNFLNQRKMLAEKELGDLSLADAKEKYSVIFKKSFYYELTEGDLKRIQDLLNEIRDLTIASKIFEEEHRSRILKRLEKLQMELHKKMSNLDKFWGLIGDAGVTLGKFGEEAKPFVDRIREIVDIIWRVQSIAEELPIGNSQPLLKEPLNIEEKKS
ncbi:MAG TPA: hypothetical protein VLH59_04325 [Ignavibacteriaceae bacterium]|nr:hypothetical protein [Ignavibacteriaceae bacterium]